MITLTETEVLSIAEKCRWKHCYEDVYVDNSGHETVIGSRLTPAGERICIEVFRLRVAPAVHKKGWVVYVAHGGLPFYAQILTSLSDSIHAALKEMVK